MEIHPCRTNTDIQGRHNDVHFDSVMPITWGMIAKRMTGAGLGLLIAAIPAALLVGGDTARKTYLQIVSSSLSDPNPRLRSGQDPHRGTDAADSRIRGEPLTLAEVRDLRRSAEDGDTQAQFNLGILYEKGRGVTKDPAQAIAWLRRAAEQGFDEAEYALGCCYNGEDGFPRSPGEAARWWAKAAAHGCAEAQYCLGLSYFVGEGVAINAAEAARWWKEAADQNQPNAQYFLGLSYCLGLGVPKAPEQAVYWLRKAGANGIADAGPLLKKLGEGRAKGS